MTWKHSITPSECVLVLAAMGNWTTDLKDISGTLREMWIAALRANKAVGSIALKSKKSITGKKLIAEPRGDYSWPTNTLEQEAFLCSRESVDVSRMINDWLKPTTNWVGKTDLDATFKKILAYDRGVLAEPKETFGKRKYEYGLDKQFDRWAHKEALESVREFLHSEDDPDLLRFLWSEVDICFDVM